MVAPLAIPQDTPDLRFQQIYNKSRQFWRSRANLHAAPTGAPQALARRRAWQCQHEPL